MTTMNTLPHPVWNPFLSHFFKLKKTNQFFKQKLICSIICTAEKESTVRKSSSSPKNGSNEETTTMYADSKSREVSPKLVVRGKKYGRRSRPQSVAPFESSQSDSEEDYDFARVPTIGEKSKNYHKVSLIDVPLLIITNYTFVYIRMNKTINEIYVLIGATIGITR